MEVVTLELVESGLKAALNRYGAAFPDSRLLEAIEYALFPAGKRVRPLMFLGLAADLKLPPAEVMPIASAIELIHSSTLIHDDLPALDDDDERRGKPSCHVRFGQAQALLAGNTMLVWALSEVCSSGCLSERVHIDASELLSRTYITVCEGQMLDLRGPQNLDALLEIHRKKTAVLFESAALLAPICSEGGPDLKESAARYGLQYGFAFQLLDDLIDADAGELEDSNVVQVAEKNEIRRLVEQNREGFNQAYEGLRSVVPAASNLSVQFQEMDGRLKEALSWGS